MEKPVGRSLPVSPFRRVVTDLMHFSRSVPSVTADRRMDLGPLIAARLACAVRPGWCVLFSKAFALLGRDYPDLRRSYLKFPWPRLYEHPHSVVSLNVERQLRDESIVLYCLIRAPENRTLAEMDALVRYHKEEPVENLRSYQRSRDITRIPWPLRHWFWWGSLNVFGRRRSHNFGTFGISSIAAQGAGLLHLIPLLTSTLHYGLFDEHGRLEMRLSWDHRVMDGATVGRVLRDLEALLNREMVREVLNSRRALPLAG
jgi:hypothetical protein